jgi:hypothetical protein
MMRTLWLPEVLRGAGLIVHEYPGWRERGSATWGPLRGVICHATAGSRISTDAGETRVLWVTGSSSAPAPISQMYLSRSGEWTVGASGRCNHVLVGDKGPHKGYGNSYLLGVEAQNDNRGEPWSATMLDSYRRGVAAICRHEDWEAWRAVAHREHQSGKSDPLGVDMTAFRATVAQLIEQEEDDVSKADVLDALQEYFNRDYSHSGLVDTDTVPEGWHRSLKSRIAYAGMVAAPVSRARFAADVWADATGTEVRAALGTVLAAVAGDDVAATLRTELDKAAARERTERAAERAALLATLTEVFPGLVAEHLSDVPAEQVRTAVMEGLATLRLVAAQD